MEVIDRIKRCKNDEELYWLTKKLIKEAIKDVKGLNSYRGLIGTKSEINRKECDFDPNKNERISVSVPFWNGYIPLGTKIVYGIACGKGFNFDSNCGYYYYVDDDSYIYDFVKSLKNYEIETTFDLITIINGFVKRLFEKYFNPKNRMEMHRLLLKGDYQFFEPIKEHSIKDFYGNGSAQCTEYALITSNLLSVLKIPVCYCMDKTHAFNLFFEKKLDKEDGYDGYILDYSEAVSAYDEQSNCVGRFPFYEKIKTEDKKNIILPDGSFVEIECEKTKEQIEEEENYFDNFLNEGKRVIMNDFFVVIINNRMFKAVKDDFRNYGVECNTVEENKILIKKR